MGTARMGDDPASSVVDRWGFAHDVPNLGIVDGSVFVTSSGVNPTATIAALALRTADHLVEEWDHRRRRPAGSARRSPSSGPPRPPRPQPAAASAASSGQAVEPPGRRAAAVLDAVLRRRLDALADDLVPAADGMPPASAVGVAGALLDRVLAVRPDLAPALQRVLEAPPALGHGWLAALRERDPEGAAALLVAVAGAYYLDDGVRALLGYPGQEPRPVNPFDHPAYVAEGLLDHLVP
jgi:hypothetical protein